MMKEPIVLAIVGVLMSGCGVTAADAPLPGNRVAGETYRVTAEFDDALNLPIGAAVKVDGIAVGKVRSVTARNFTARVEFEVKEAYQFRSGASARLRSSTPLGELFVDVDDIDKGEPLNSGDVLQATSTAPSIEDTMAATSMLLNGGNLGKIRSIVREANLALGGREDDARDLLDEATLATKSLGESTDDIDRTLAALSDLSETLDKREKSINAAMKDFPAAAKVLRDNTDEITKLLTGIKNLGAVSERVISKTQADLLQMVRQTSPLLEEISGLREEIGPGLTDLAEFATLLDSAVPTDYLNLYQYFDSSATLGGLPDLAPGLDIPAESYSGLSVPGLELPEIEMPELGLDPSAPDVGLGGLLGNPAGAKQ